MLLPKSMKFNGISGGFAQDVDEAGLAVFFAKNVQANQEVKFSVSGEGLVPTELRAAAIPASRRARAAERRFPVPLAVHEKLSGLSWARW